MKFNRPAVKEKESMSAESINMDAFEDEIRLDEDVNLVAEFEEENDEEDVKKMSDIETVHEETAEIEEEIKEEITVEDENVVLEKHLVTEGDLTMNLKEKLQKINAENAEMVAEVEETLTAEAMSSNATSMTLSVDENKLSYLKKYLESNGLEVTVLENGDLKVDWS